MDAQILFPEIDLYSISSNQSVSLNRSKRKMPVNFEFGNSSSVQMVKPLQFLSKSKKKKLRLMEKKKSISVSGMINGGDCDLCATSCENNGGFVDGSSPPAIEVEKNTSSANNPSSALNASASPVVSVAVSAVALAVSQPSIPLFIYNLRSRRKC